jgi:DNA-binding MarR family transcriptional regulator
MIPAFEFKAPTLPPPPFTDNTAIDASRETMLPVAQAHTAAAELIEQANQLAPTIAADPNLTDQGKQAQFTEKVAAPGIAKLREHQAALDKAGAALEKRVADLTAEPEPTHATAIERQERLALATAFGSKPEHQRIKLLEAAMVGRDPDMAAALAYGHPAITGLGAPVIKILREKIEDSRIDPAVQEDLRTQAERIGMAKATVAKALDALERAADRKKLKESGLSTLRRSDMDEKAKVAFISKNGLAAFQALPN